MNCKCEDYEYEEYSNTKMSELLTETYSNKTVKQICCDDHLMGIHFTDEATLTIEIENIDEKIVPKCDNILDEVLHHLDSTHGLYCTDLEEPVKEEMFKLNNEGLIKKVKKLQEIVGGDFVPNKHCARLHITNTKEINELNKQVKELNKRLQVIEEEILKD